MTNKIDFPSMDSEKQGDLANLRKLKFKEQTARVEAKKIAERERRRLFLLEQEIITEQGGLNSAGLKEGYLEKWMDENPEYMKGVREKWAKEDHLLEEEQEGRFSLYD